MSEWSRKTVTNLLDAYRKEEVLYNASSSHYHNKTVRNEAWQRILAVVVKTQEETTLIDLNKKIQSMRTQFGQEVSKMDKTMNSDHVYQPKVWWFKHFTWIAEFMKTRGDQTPMSETIRLVSAKVDKPSPAAVKPAAAEIILLNQIDAAENLTDEFEEEFDASPPPRKIQKTIKAKSRMETSSSKDSNIPQHIETIEYTLIDEDQNETLISEKSKSQYIDFQCEQRNLKKNKRRSKAFGKYISALLIDIDNDSIFFDLQNNITKLIQEAAMRQQNLTKS